MGRPFGKRKVPQKDDFSSKFRVNREIHISGNVRIVGDGIESIIVPMTKARELAESKGLDCVELIGKGDLPIIRICSYEKMIYEMKKSAKKAKQNVKQMKDVQLSVNIAKHDLETKANSARKFLEEGNRVRVTLAMRGREMARREENKKSILEFIVMLEDVGVPEGKLRDEGNKTVVILKRKNGHAAKKEETDAEA